MCMWEEVALIRVKSLDLHVEESRKKINGRQTADELPQTDSLEKLNSSCHGYCVSSPSSPPMGFVTSTPASL